MGTLQLTRNRYTLVAFSALAVVTLAVTVGMIIWVLLPPPAQAGTCGIYMTYQSNCRMQVNSSGSSCGTGGGKVWWIGYSTHYQAWEAPHSYESLGMYEDRWCALTKPSPNCPSFCQH